MTRRCPRPKSGSKAFQRERCGPKKSGGKNNKKHEKKKRQASLRAMERSFMTGSP